MYMIQHIVISGIIMLLLDSIYLRAVSSYFDRQIRLVQGSSLVIDIAGAIVSYFFLFFGLYYFILREKKSIKDAFLLGLIIYMVYEATNKAIIKNWHWTTVLLDGIWGGFLFAFTTYITYYLL